MVRTDHATYGWLGKTEMESPSWRQTRWVACHLLLGQDWDKPDDVYMLWVYRKSSQEDLTAQQAKLLSELVREYLS